MSLTSRRTAMARKRYKPEEIVAKLRQVDVLVSQGQGMTDAIRQIGVSEVTYRARLRRVAGCATSSGFAGHAGATANLKLTFHPDHSVGANHYSARDRRR